MTRALEPRSRARRSLVWLRRGLALLVLVGLLWTAPLLFPQPLFPHQERIGILTVWSDGELPPDLAAAAADALRRIEAMELHRQDERYRVFLCQSPRLYAVFAFLTRTRADTQGLVLTAAGNIILSLPGMRGIAERTGGRPRFSRFEGRLAAAIAHEVAHLQVADAVARGGLDRPPFWKVEGYVEYVAHLAATRAASDYDLPSRVELLLDDRFWMPPYRTVDRRLFRWHLLVEYLCEIRGYDFPALVADARDEEAITREMLAWLAAR